MALKTHNCNAFTGGGARALDRYAIATLLDGYRAHVVVGGVYTYMVFDASATDAEDVATHPFKVRPDDYGAGPGVWIEQIGSDASATEKGIVELNTDAEAKTGADTVRAITAANLKAAMGGITTVVDTYSTLVTDVIVYCNKATAFTVTLLAAATAASGKLVTITNINTGLIKITGNGSETIGGMANQYLAQYESITLSCDGSNWQIDEDGRICVLLNLLTNSGFGVWSNSTLEDVRNLPDATTTVAGTTCTSTAHLLTKGMLVTDDTAACFEVVSITDANIFEVDRTGASSGTQWQEVTPGCVAADALGPDGWEKDTGTNCFRQHKDATYTKSSFYSLKLNFDTQAHGFVTLWDLRTGQLNKSTQLAGFRNRTMTFGSWIYSSAADVVRLYARTDSGYTYQAVDHVGGGWEWHEVTFVVPDAVTFMLTGWLSDGVNWSGNDVYIEEPMLVFGSSIGEGNYSPKPQEIVWAEAAITLTDYTAASISANAAINLEAQASGKVPKGVTAIYTTLFGTCASTSALLALIKDSSLVELLPLPSQVAAVENATSIWVPCDPSGDIYIYRDATFTAVSIKIIGLQL